MGLMLIAGVGVAQAASDDEKLKELERAMNAPSDTGMAKPKMRTRAIVFDNQPQTGSQAAESAAPAVAAAASGGRDCANLPPDVKAIGVDFAIQLMPVAPLFPLLLRVLWIRFPRCWHSRRIVA